MSGGEAFFIWWLKVGYVMSAQGHEVEGVTNSIYCKNVDNISKVKFQLTTRSSDTLYGDFYLFNTRYSYSAVSGTKIVELTPRANTYIQTASQSQYSIGEIRVLSFTTTDGKVHTADNLNY